MKAYFVFSIICWFTVLLIQVLSFTNYNFPILIPYEWFLFLGLFICWIPVPSIVRNKMADKSKGFIQRIQDGEMVKNQSMKSIISIFALNKSRWINAVIILSLIYGLGNFIMLLVPSCNCDGLILDNKYLIFYHSGFLNLDATQQQYNHCKGFQLRAATGILLFFYSMAFSNFYSTIKQFE